MRCFTTSLSQLIGVGGMGVVWCVTDFNLGRQVAIKILPDAFAHDPERLARFEREAKTLASLNHPNIAHQPAGEEHDRSGCPGTTIVMSDDLCRSTRFLTRTTFSRSGTTK